MVDVGKQIGPYQIIAPLGSGGMGQVYRAKDQRLEREVAVKVLPPQFASDPDRKARFEREAKAVAALSHPNILSIHDFGTESGVSFAVTELLEGETLRQRVDAGPMPWRRAMDVAVAIADGLAAAHAKGIVHRDLKPENIFITHDGRVKILDFGLARVELKNTSMTDTTPYTPAKTDPGAVMGTVGYMSPEQVRGHPVDPRSDIFALGCVMYEMVTGTRAFYRETAAETMTAILHDDPADLADSGRRVPVEVDRVIRHCLEKSSAARFHSAHDLAFALRAIVADSGPQEMASPRVARPRRRLWIAAAVVAAVVAIAVILRVAIVPGGGTSGGPAGGVRIESLAVLPFENLGNDPYTGFLTDSMFENLIITLSQLQDQGIDVRPSAAVSRYKGQAIDVPQVGRDLSVQAVITGKLNQYEDDLTINIALVDTRQNRNLWGKQYQGKRDDLRVLQETMVKEISAALGAKPAQ
jgi:TolB-like protein